MNMNHFQGNLSDISAKKEPLPGYPLKCCRYFWYRISLCFELKSCLLVHRHTDLSLDERLPLVYLAANSGARAGLDSELKELFQVPIASFFRIK